MTEQSKETLKQSVRPDSPGTTFKRLFGYFRYDKGMLIFGVAMILLGSIGSVVINAMLSPIIDAVVAKDIDAVVKYLGIMLGITVALVLGQYLGMRIMANLSQKVVFRLRKDLFQKLQQLPISFFDTNSHGEVMSSFTNDINMIDQILDQGITQAFTAIITVVGAFIMMTVLSPILTLLVLGMILFMFVLIRFVGSKSATFYRSRQKSTASINGYVEEMITAQKVVKVFNYEDRAVDAFEERNEKMRIDSTNAQTYGVLLLPVMGNLSYILYALVAIIGSILVMNATITVGNIASFLQYTRIVTRPITMISNQMNMAFAALAGAERVFKIIDLEPEEMAGEVQLVETCDGIQDICWRVPDGKETTMVPVCGDVRFENVDFSYVPGTPILKDISLFAKPGQKIAFVGSTGAGKTTITNLINRFYEIDSGTITLDGIDIRRIDKGDLRSIMSMVLQDVHLFRGTIAENIRYGKLDATDAEIKEAAKIANADYFISQLSDGYDTVIGEDGANLSQGERQLLSIARAAVADPLVIILDEATSSVDTRTERLIEQGMDELMRGRTTFIIAHRLSTVRRADAILVLEQGRIIERGNHDELMERKGRYYQLNTGLAELS